MQPGTPMGDLFPLGGAMGRAQRRAFPQPCLSFAVTSRQALRRNTLGTSFQDGCARGICRGGQTRGQNDPKTTPNRPEIDRRRCEAPKKPMSERPRNDPNLT